MRTLNLKVAKNEQLFVQEENGEAILYVVGNTLTDVIKRYETGITALFEGCFGVADKKEFLSALKVIDIMQFYLEDGLLKCGALSFEVTKMDSIKVPATEVTYRTITPSTLKKLKNCDCFVSDCKRIIQFFCFSGDKIIATDGHILSCVQNDFSVDKEVLLPPTVFDLQTKNEVLIGISEDYTILKSRMVTIYIKNIKDFQFPNWKRVVPDINRYKESDIDLSLFGNSNIFKFISTQGNRIKIKDGSVICKDTIIGYIGNCINGYTVNAKYLKDTSKLLGNKIKCYYDCENTDKAIYLKNENENDFVIFMPIF